MIKHQPIKTALRLAALPLLALVFAALSASRSLAAATTYDVASGTHTPSEYSGNVTTTIASTGTTIYNIADDGLLVFSNSVSPIFPTTTRAFSLSTTAGLTIGPAASAVDGTGRTIFENFSITTSGGGIIVTSTNANLFLVNVTFRNNQYLNTSTAAGSALYSEYDRATLNNVIFEGNSAVGSAGAVRSRSTTFTMNGGAFIGNYISGTVSTGGGGAITLERYSVTAVFDSVAFNNNRARTTGGAMRSIGGRVTLRDIEFSNNWAGDSGGALWLNDARYFFNFEVTSGTLTYSGNAAGGDAVDTSVLMPALVSGSRPFDGVAWAGGFLFSGTGGTYNTIPVQFNISNNAALVIGSPTEGNKALDSIATDNITAIDQVKPFQKTGDGALMLNADNSYSQAEWKINAGKVLLGNNEAQLGGRLITVADSATFGGAGTVRTRYRDGNSDVEVSGTVLVQPGAIIQVGAGGATDKLTVKNDFMVGGDGVTYDYNLGLNNQSPLLALNNFDVSAYSGTINLSSFVTGTFALMTWAQSAGDVSAYFGNGGNLLFAGSSTPPGRVGSSSLGVVSGTALQVQIEMANSSSLAWTGVSDAVWRAGDATANWSGSTAAGAVTDFQSGDTVYFDGVADASQSEHRMITLAAGVSVGGMTVSGTADYKFEGAGVTAGTLLKAGAATLSLHNGANQFGEIHLRSGTLSALSAANIGNELGRITAAAFGADGPATLMFAGDATFDAAGAGTPSQTIILTDPARQITLGATDGKTLSVKNVSSGTAMGNAGRLMLVNAAFSGNMTALANTGTLLYTVTSGTVASAGNTVFLAQDAAGRLVNINVAAGATFILGDTADAAKDRLDVTAGTLDKTGLGTWILNSDNASFGHALTVSEGSFLLGGTTVRIGGTVNAAAGTLIGGLGNYGKLVLSGGTLQAGLAGAATGQELTVADLSLADTVLRFGFHSDSTNDRLILNTLSGFTGTNTIDLDEFRWGEYIIATGDVGLLNNIKVTIAGANQDGPRQQMKAVAGSGTLTLIGSSGPSLDLTWNGSGPSPWDTTTEAWAKTGSTAGITFANWDRVTFDGSAAGQDHTVTLAHAVSVSDMIVSGTEGYIFDGSAGITSRAEVMPDTVLPGAPSGKLYKYGSGTLAFHNTGTNLFQGGIDWHGGTIVITNGGQLVTGTAAAMNIIGEGVLRAEGAAMTLSTPIVLAGPSAKLTVTNTSSLALSGVISGDGQLVLGGTTRLSGINTYTGTATLAANSTLTISRDENLGGTTAALAIGGNNSRLIVDGNVTIARIINAAYNFTLATTGSNELTLARDGGGQITGTGTVTLSGRLHARENGVLGDTASWIINNGSVLRLSADQSLRDLKNNGLIRFQPANGGTYHSLQIRNLSTDGGGIEMNFNLEANSADRLTIIGAASGAHSLTLNREGGLPSRPQDVDILIATFGDIDPSLAFNLTNPGVLSIGLDSYVLKLDRQAEEMRLVSSGISNIGDAILATAGVLGLDWHYSLDSIHKRMGEFRGKNKPAGGDLWLRGNAYHLAATHDLIGDAFEQDAYEVSIGIDKGFASGNSTLHAGVFVAHGETRRDFDSFGDGKTTGIGAGLYAAWVHDRGWYVDAMARFDQYKNEFNARAGDAFSHASYNNHVQGLSLELGKRIGLGRSIWLEPSLQGAVAMLNGKSYATDDGFDVVVDDSTAAQCRVQLRAGADWGAWTPWLKLAGVRSETQDGLVHVAGRRYAPDFDGDRIEAGAGVSWFMTAGSQIYLDYEYNKADQYERPWAVNLGLRLNW